MAGSSWTSTKELSLLTLFCCSGWIVTLTALWITRHPPPTPHPLFFSSTFFSRDWRGISRWVQCIKNVCGLTTVTGWYILMISFQIPASFLSLCVQCTQLDHDQPDTFPFSLILLIYWRVSTCAIQSMAFLGLRKSSLKCGHQVWILSIWKWNEWFKIAKETEKYSLSFGMTTGLLY